jgi:hypothetical protein
MVKIVMISTRASIPKSRLECANLPSRFPTGKRGNNGNNRARRLNQRFAGIKGAAHHLDDTESPTQTLTKTQSAIRRCAQSGAFLIPTPGLSTLVAARAPL